MKSCKPNNCLTKGVFNEGSIAAKRQATDEQEADLISNTSEEYEKKMSFIFRIIKYKGRRRKSTKFLDRFLERQKKGKYAKLSDSLSDLQLQNLDVHHLLTSPVFTKESIINYTSMGPQNASRTSSSLDLEWEHEYGQVRAYPAIIQSTLPNNYQNLHNIPKYNEAGQNQDTTVHEENNVLAETCKTDLDAGSITDAESIAQVVDIEQALLGRRFVRVYSSCKRAGSFSRTSSLNSSSYNSTPESLDIPSLEWDIDEEQQRQLYVEDDSLDHETLKLLHQIEQLKNQVLNETGDAFCENENIVFHSKSQTHINGTRNDIINIS